MIVKVCIPRPEWSVKSPAEPTVSGDMAYRRQARFVPDVDGARAIIDLGHVPADAVFELSSDPANLFMTINSLGVADHFGWQTCR